MAHQFSKRSKDQLATCHEDLRVIAAEVLKHSDVDFTITEGRRSIERQQQLFREGKSKIDGVTKLGKHNMDPSLAFDIIAAVPGRPDLAYHIPHLVYLGGAFTSTANRLYEEGCITHKLRWGYNWDMDGEIGTDQRFQDLPHYELYKPAA